MEFETGAKLSLSMLLYSRGHSSRIIVGEKAQIQSGAGIDGLLLQPRDRKQKERTITISGDRNETNDNMYKDFFECVRTGRLPVSNALSAKDAVLSAYACQCAVYAGELIHVKELDV